MLMNILRILGVSSLVACAALLVCAVVVESNAYESALRYTPDEVATDTSVTTRLDESILAKRQNVARQLGQAGGIAALVGIVFSAVVWFSERKRHRQRKSRRTYIRPRSRVRS